MCCLPRPFLPHVQQHMMNQGRTPALQDQPSFLPHTAHGTHLVLLFQPSNDAIDGCLKLGEVNAIQVEAGSKLRSSTHMEKRAWQADMGAQQVLSHMEGVPCAFNAGRQAQDTQACAAPRSMRARAAFH